MPFGVSWCSCLLGLGLWLGSLAGFGQAPTPSSKVVKPAAAAIPWSADRPLALADFQGRPRPGEPLAALTSATVSARAACQGSQFTGSVQAVFDPAASWVREPRKATPALLRHEQLHFDITELYARRLRQQLAQLHPDCAKLGPVFDRVSKAVYAEWDREEARYDRETNHGLNAEKQAAWQAQVQAQLVALASFAL